VPLKMAPKRVRALYLQRWTRRPDGVAADKTVVRCNDGNAPDYDVHVRMLARSEATLVLNTNYHASLFPFAKDRRVIPPMLGSVPRVPKVPGQFVFASAAPKGLQETLTYWAKIHPMAIEHRPVSLVIAVPGYSGAIPDLPREAESLGIRTVGAPTLEEYRRLIAESEGLFYVSRFTEMFGCVAALSDMAGTRTHILCLRGAGGIREAVSDARFVTTDPAQFTRDFLDALTKPAEAFQRFTPIDRSPNAIAPLWEDALGLLPK